MKVCIYGAGAIGGHLAARLAAGGAEVSLVARGPQLATIQARGLTVKTPEGIMECRPRASADPGELGPQDAVIVTVKAPALPAVGAGIAPLLRPDTAVIFAMNGCPGGTSITTAGNSTAMRCRRSTPAARCARRSASIAPRQASSILPARSLSRASPTWPTAGTASCSATPRKPREGTKQEQVLAMLRRPDGATVAQIAEATGWAQHTVRGFFAGLKKRQGIEVQVLERVRQVGPNKEGALGSNTVCHLPA